MLALFTIQHLSSVEKEGKKSSGLGFRVRVGAPNTCNTCNGIEYRRERAISRTGKTGSDFVAEGGLRV